MKNAIKYLNITTESKKFKKTCDDMNKYCQASITYPMKENVVVDKALISTWVSADADMNVTFNEEAVRAWMRDFGKTYDTVGTTRTITSPTGKTVEVVRRYLRLVDRIEDG